MGQYNWAGVKAGDDPNDPSKTGGAHKDPVESMSPQQKSVLTNFPKAPDKSPFKG